MRKPSASGAHRVDHDCIASNLLIHGRVMAIVTVMAIQTVMAIKTVLAIVTVLAIKTVMAIVIVLAIRIDIAIVTVLAIEINIHLSGIEPGIKCKERVLG